MPRVLHVCSVHADLQTTRSLNLLSSAALARLSDNHLSTEIVRIGPAGEFPNLASATLSLRARRGPNTDIIHAWGPVELAAAVLAGFDRIIFSPPATIPTRWHKWLRMIYKHRPIQVVLPSPHSRDPLNGQAVHLRPTIIPPGVAPLGLGDVLWQPLPLTLTSSPCIQGEGRGGGSSVVPENRAASVPSHPLPEDAQGSNPTVASHPQRNDSLRNQLGISPEDFIVLAPGESTRAANHIGALWSVGILYTLSENYRILTWGPGEMSDALARLAQKMGQPQMLVRAQQILQRPIDFDSLLTIADAAAVTGQRGVSMLPTLMCLAAGIPIAAYRIPIWNGILQPNVNALIDNSRTPRTLGQSLMDLRADPALRQRLGQAARKTAIENFSIEKFLQNWNALYQEIANQDSPARKNKFSEPFSSM